MGETTGIEWTDATWTPVRARYDATIVIETDEAREEVRHVALGWHCEHVSEGCRHCYAETFNLRLGTGLDFKPGNLAPRGAVEVFLDDKLLVAPLRWRKPRRIFVCSMTDLFGSWVTDEMIDRVFAVIALCPQHMFQLLTKRPERMREYLTSTDVRDRIDSDMNVIVDERVDPTARRSDDLRATAPDLDETWPLPNVWLGTSVEDQGAADARIPHLLATPAARRFLSCEPLLGPVDLTRVHEVDDDGRGHGWESCLNGKRFSAWGGDGNGGDVDGHPKIDWVIVGGESGREARPMHPDWARSLREQCAAAGVPFFFKQWGEWVPASNFDETPLLGETDRIWFRLPDVTTVARVGKKRAGRLLDGVTHDGMPA